MIFEGKIDLDVPRAKTWDFLIDINKFSSCLPGLQEVKAPWQYAFASIRSTAGSA